MLFQSQLSIQFGTSEIKQEYRQLSLSIETEPLTLLNKLIFTWQYSVMSFSGQLYFITAINKGNIITDLVVYRLFFWENSKGF